MSQDIPSLADCWMPIDFCGGAEFQGDTSRVYQVLIDKELTMQRESSAVVVCVREN